MEFTEQHTADLHRKAGDALGAMGQPANTVPPNEESVLGEGLREAGYAVGSSIQETFHGKGSDSDVRTTPSRRPVRWVLERARRAAGLRQKKAA